MSNDSYDLYVKLLNFSWGIEVDENCTLPDSLHINNTRNLTAYHEKEVFTCPDNCEECDEESGMCDRCEDGFLLLPNENDTYSCIENPCEEGLLYNFTTQECFACQREGCSVCPDNKTCEECAPGYYRLNVKGQGI